MDTTPSTSSDVFKITGNWHEKSKKLQELFAQLTESDLKFEKGKDEELLNRVALRFNKKRGKFINIIHKG